MEPIISLRNIGKRYSLQSSGTPRGHDTLRDLVASWASGARRAERAGHRQDLWALKDVSFDIGEGEVVGLVGRNGSGKSTLLKILSRITAPTKGEAVLNGRVGSLLEVGTGFHPELTGRENIYFNGAILGLKKQEIHARLDEIVAFSGIEQFIDTPIKRYSSGMTMRLAFSVAAHLDPEIMIVDEVLAVGDLEFQNKCLGKMQDVARAGRTVLFVSHNMNAVRQMCGRVIWLSNGALRLDTRQVDDAISAYTQAGGTRQDWRLTLPIRHEHFTVHGFGTFLDTPANPCTRFGDAEAAGVELDIDVHRYSPLLNFGIQVHDGLGNPLFLSLNTDGAESGWPIRSAGRHRIATRLPARMLNAGDYSVRLIASLHDQRWLLGPEDSDIVIPFTVEQTSLQSPHWRSRRPGLLGPQLKWVRV